jgi:Fic family protein
MHDSLNQFEKFLHGGAEEFPALVQAAMLHLQFESIHPFLDGNGRLGRLLVTLLLTERGLLAEPLLYPSLYLKQHRDRYYSLLQDVRVNGDWEAWLEFFLEAIASTAESAVEVAKRVLQRFHEDEEVVRKKGARYASVAAVLHALQYVPVTTATSLVTRTQLSLPTVNRALDELQALSLLKEVTGKGRNRIYRYEKYVAMLNEGTEL